MFRILEKISECLLVVNESNQIEYANKSLEKVFGYQPNELINRPLNLLIPKEYSDRHANHIKKYFKAPSSRRMGDGKELYGLHKNGTIFPIEVSLSHMEFEARKLAVAIVVDVSEQRKILNELNLSRSLYSSLVENTVDHIFQIDLDLTVQYINHVSPGLTKEMVIGSNLLNLLPSKEAKETAKKTIESVFKTGNPASYEIEFPTPVGSINYSTTVSPVITGGKIVGANLISRDFTELLNLKSSLIEKQNFIDKISNYSINGIYIYNVKKGFNTYINKAYTHILGYTIEDINQMNQEVFFALFHPEDQKNVADHMQKIATISRGKTYEIEYRFRAKTGNWVWCRSLDSGFEYDKDGNLISFIGSFVDITNQKESEILLKHQNKEMESFAHVVSHDLRAPLANIIQTLEYLHNNNFVSSEKHKDLVSMLLSTSDRAITMIESLLCRAKINQEQKMESIDPNEIINELKIDLYTQIQENSAQISSQKLPEIFGVKALFRLLVQNLITNSLKFKSDNSPPEIWITCEENISHWIFTVKDNGRGIPKKEIDSVFKMFTRGTNHSSTEGSGIGLANCHKIVELHKGNIRVESEEGKGASFIFTISKALKHYLPSHSGPN